MSKIRVITIGRQSGSGGSEIGRKVAEALGFTYFDKNLISKAAEESGFSEGVLKTMDERPKSLLFSLAMNPYNICTFGGTPYDSLEQRANDAIYSSIEKLAEEGSCVIVGRCADYVLRNRDDVLNVFVTAPEDARTKRVMERLDFDDKKARDSIRKTDKRRSSYYNYITNNKWGDITNYDLCIDSSLLGIDETVKLICDVAQKIQ